MEECKCGRIPPCYSGKKFRIHEELEKIKVGDETNDMVYELNKQMCDLEIDRERWDKLGKEWDSKKKEIVYSIFNENDMEKKKMTKAEAFEYLKGKKVRVYGREMNDKVQSKLFACGVEWKHLGTDVCYYSNYLVINPEGFLCHCDGMGEDYWNRLFHKEISAEEIFSIEIVQENRSEDELVEIVELGEKIQCLLAKLSGHRHVVITETDVLLYDEGMCLSHSDPF